MSEEPEKHTEEQTPQTAQTPPRKKRRIGKLGCALRVFILLAIAGAWIASLQYLAPEETSAVFYINGDVIPMAADEHIVARVANKNCRVKNCRTKTPVKSLSFIKSSGETEYALDVDFEYLADWNAFSVEQTPERIVCTFKKLELKKPVRYEIKSRSTTRGLFVGEAALEASEREFFAEGGVFQTQMQAAAKGGEYMKMAEAEAAKSLAKIMKSRVFALLKIKPGRREIIINFSDSPSGEKIVDMKQISR